MKTILQEPRYFCALGAQQAVTAIDRAIPIVHAGPGCSAKLFQAMAGSGGNQGAGYAGGDAIPCTNMVERDVVFGGADKLRRLIESTLRVMDGDLFVVLTGCTSDLVGDDVGSVVREFREKGVPIIYAETGGFKGDAFVGYELFLQALIGQFLRPAEKKEPGLVNVFASVPYLDPFWEGDLAEIKRLLTSLGLKANVLFGWAGGGVEALKKIPAAQFNLVVSPYVGLKAAKLLREKFGTPYLHIPVFPVGGVETSRFLKKVAAYAGVDEKFAGRAVKRQEDEYFHYLAKAADFLIETRYSLPKKFITIGEPACCLGLASFLVNDMGLVPARQFIAQDVPEAFRDSIRDLFRRLSPEESAEVTFAQDGGEINEKIRQETDGLGNDLILGSSWDKDIADEVNGLFLDVGLPVTDRLILHHSYAGYRGGLNLAEEIYSRLLEQQNGS
ncbi:MAG: hydrogenase [Oscillospiraceae bacterium]|jgi:nitrogenase molybdenum-iron protein beta chain|nr:hydrogenase [Oscillospiraceae bacterium]MCI1990156.1 hydrogenase [Oscillospiraceae bacterium]MCI2034887.1 hydrogenase [Oscillospiraceae bacterium]